MSSHPGVVHATVSAEPIDAAALEALVVDPTHGAMTTFVGRVRDHDPEARGEVVALDYSCHPDAPTLIGSIAAETLDAHDPDGETRVAVAHRVGHLGVGDIAIVAVVASAHRAVTFTCLLYTSDAADE